MQGKGDPGYSQTSRMLLEAGICLLKDEASDFCLQVTTPTIFECNVFCSCVLRNKATRLRGMSTKR